MQADGIAQAEGGLAIPLSDQQQAALAGQRSVTLGVREELYIEAARISGLSDLAIIVRDAPELGDANLGRIVQVKAHDAAEVESLLALLRASGVKVEDLEIGRADLEDVFLEIMQGEPAREAA